ncbi:homeodomain-like protein [Tanacetum coccineum]
MEEINNFQQEPDETLYQAWERAIPTMTTADAKTAIQDMAEYSQKWHNETSRGRSTETSNGLAAIQAQFKNLGREIKKVNEKVYAAQVGYAAIRNQGASIKTLEIQIGQMRKNSKLVYKSRQTMVPFLSRLDNHYYAEEEEGIYGPKFTEAYRASHINHTIPQKEKDPGIFTLPCFINNVCFDNALVDLGASVSVMPLLTYLNLELGELAHTRFTVELADRTVKYPKGIAENVLVGIEARLMGETLVLNRSLYPFLKDYIELNELNEPIELRRNQGDDLMPTIKEGEVIVEFRTMDEDLDIGIDGYPSYCDDDKKIHIDCAHNLKFSCMIGFEFTHVNFFPLLYVDMMSRKFYNSIMKNKMVYKGDNVVGALMNVPIFVGTFSVMTDFAVLEDMDAYRDEGMADVIFGKPFLREVGIKTKRFKGIITLYNGDDEITYQMVSEKDKKNGISHAYRKLKGLYKGVLNLGPDYIRDAKMEEWLTRGHISVHEME